MIEWSWRIELPKSILGGSWSDERRWPTMFAKLINLEIVKVEFQGALPEIVLHLSNGMRVLSFMTAEGQPSWSILAHNAQLGTLSVKRGRFSIEGESK